MKKPIKYLLLLIAFYVFIYLIIGFKGCKSDDTEIKETMLTDTIVKTDTIVVYDTIRIKEPKPYFVEVVRSDTVYINDTMYLVLPIEQKEYISEAYRAVIEGYKPQLVSLDLYNKTTLIHDTTLINNSKIRYKIPRWTISVGAGIGYTLKGFEPYIGINAGYVLWSK